MCLLVREPKQWQEYANKPHSVMQNIKSKWQQQCFTSLCADCAVRLLRWKLQRRGKAHIPNHLTISTPGTVGSEEVVPTSKRAFYFPTGDRFIYKYKRCHLELSSIGRRGGLAHLQTTNSQVRLCNIFWKATRFKVKQRVKQRFGFRKRQLCSISFPWSNQCYQTSPRASWFNSSKTIWRPCSSHAWTFWGRC